MTVAGRPISFLINKGGNFSVLIHYWGPTSAAPTSTVRVEEKSFSSSGHWPHPPAHLCLPSVTALSRQCSAHLRPLATVNPRVWNTSHPTITAHHPPVQIVSFVLDTGASFSLLTFSGHTLDSSISIKGDSNIPIKTKLTPTSSLHLWLLDSGPCLPHDTTMPNAPNRQRSPLQTKSLSLHTTTRLHLDLLSTTPPL